MTTNMHYFNSFTIEGSGDESADALIGQMQDLLHDWVRKKELGFGRTEDEIAPISRSAFAEGGQWGNSRLRESACATVSGQLDGGKNAWGLRYRHSFEDYSTESVILEVTAAETSPNAVAVAVSLFFKGERHIVLSPPAFVSALLHLGARTYNSQCYSSRFFDLVQKSVAYARGAGPLPSVPLGELAVFVGNKTRMETVVAVCRRDTEWGGDTWASIRRMATNLSGRVLVFLLDTTQYSGGIVYRPREAFVNGKPFPFPPYDWRLLESKLAKQGDFLPVEADVPAYWDQLSESIARPAPPAPSPAPTALPPPSPASPSPPPAPPSPPAPPPPAPSAPSQPPSATGSNLAQATDRLRKAFASLAGTLDELLKGGEERP